MTQKREYRFLHVLGFLFICVSPLIGVPPMFGADFLARFSQQPGVVISDVATDDAGNTYLCGYTSNRQSFPGAKRFTVGGGGETGFDAFVTKYAPNGARAGTVLFCGEGSDYALKIATGTDGSVVVVGHTDSLLFPVRDAFQSANAGSQDMFIVKLDGARMEVLFATLLGGSSYEYPTALKVSWYGDIVIAASTESPDFPRSTPSDGRLGFPKGALIAWVAGDGSQLNLLRHFGGSASDGIQAMVLDEYGSVFMAGRAFSADFPTTEFALQPARANWDEAAYYSTEAVFVAGMYADGETMFSTFLTGNFTGYSDEVQGIALTPYGDIAVAGRTPSPVFPALDTQPTPPVFPLTNRAFLATISWDGSALLDTKFFKFSGYDNFRDLATSPDGSVVGALSLGGAAAFVKLDENGAVLTGGVNPPCLSPRTIDRMAFDGQGRLVLIGKEHSSLPTFAGAYALRLRPGEWSSPAPIQVRFEFPLSGSTIPLRSGYSTQLRALVLGATGRVDSVKFYDGRRLLGTATNAPFDFFWSDPPRGVHRLKAVANVGGREVASCVSMISFIAPRNDDFAKRTVLRGPKVNVVDDNLGASREWPLENNGNGDASVWYTWQAPETGVYELRLTDLSGVPYTALSSTVFAGESASTMSEVQSTSWSYGGLVRLRVRRGETFQIRVATHYGGETRFRLRLTRVIPPKNDAFARATILSGANATAAVRLAGATSEPGEHYYSAPPHTNYAGMATVWYSWTAPASGLFLFSVQGRGTPPYCQCFTGESLGILTDAGQRITGATNGIALHAVAGTRYFFKLAGENENPLEVSIRPYIAPPNDDFANRWVIPAGFHSATGTMIGATYELFEGMQTSGLAPAIGGSVWFTWTAPSDGVFSASIRSLERPAGSRAFLAVPDSPTPRVQVYQGESTTGLTNVVVPGSIWAFMHFATRAGERYQIAVSTSHALFRIDLTPVPVPENDNFVSAILLLGPTVFAGGTSIGAGVEPGERVRSYLPWGTANQSVWYRWTAPSNGYFAFAAAGSLVELYRGNSLTNAELVDANTDRLLVSVTEGIHYRIAVVGGADFGLNVQPARRPTNDDFADRRIIEGVGVEFTGALRNATAEPEEPGADYYRSAVRSVWYSWTAPAAGVYSLRSLAYSPAHVTVFTGESLTNLTRICTGGFYWDDGVEFFAQSGVTYQFAVDSTYDPAAYGAGGLTMALASVPPPANDHFENRASLAGAQISITSSNNGATLQAGEPSVGSTGGGQTVWWSWRAPQSGRCTFAVSSPDFSHGFLLGVFSGGALDELIQLSSTEDQNGAVNIPVVAGEDYQIAIDRSRSSSPGSFELAIRPTGSPASDAFASRVPLTNLATVTLEGGSLEPDEPERSGSFITSTVWWTWTAPSNGTYRFSLTASATAFSGLRGMEIFTGDSLPDLERVLADSGFSYSVVHAHVVTGITYVVRVSGLSGWPYGYTFSAAHVPPPINDNFASRIAVPDLGAWMSGSNLTATAESGEPLFGEFSEPAQRSVWWTWTATTNGQVEVAGRSYYYYYLHRVGIFTGDALESLEPVAMGTTSFGYPRFTAVAGTTYQISFDTPYSSFGSAYNFSWYLRESEPDPTVPPRNIPPRLPALVPILTNPVAGQTVVETSTNLTDWIALTNALSPFHFSPTTNEPMRFFRLR